MGRRKISTDEYKQRLSEKYGYSFLEDLDSVFSGNIRLIDLSKKYNISKMWATLVFKRVYGKSFKIVRAESNLYVRNKAKTNSSDPGKFRNFTVCMPEELYNELTIHSKRIGLPISVIVRECISSRFNKEDGLNKAITFF